MTTCIRRAAPFSGERTEEIIRDFKRDGFVLIPGVLEEEETRALRDKIDELAEKPELEKSGHRAKSPFIIWHLNELDRIFCDMLIREPIYTLMEAIFGEGFQQCGNQVLRNGEGQQIDHWHVDNALWFPLPDEVPRHDPRIEMPVFWLTVQIALTDIDTLDHGPSQYIPGSHYAGRHPTKDETTQFEGQSPVSVLCRSGDIYLHNPQCWHRGTPNRSGKLRYVLQQQYGQSWAFRRYNAYILHKMPEDLLEGADERLFKVLGSFRFNPEDYYHFR
jgi:ectoine hydroxylase-related dioxygenase (phytanoyl-CoA dioxygenase family)